jgi:hypothetical protein
VAAVGPPQVAQFTGVFYALQPLGLKLHLLPQRKQQGAGKKKSGKSRFWIFGRIFCKNFSTRYFW